MDSFSFSYKCMKYACWLDGQLGRQAGRLILRNCKASRSVVAMVPFKTIAGTALEPRGRQLLQGVAQFGQELGSTTTGETP